MVTTASEIEYEEITNKRLEELRWRCINIAEDDNYRMNIRTQVEQSLVLIENEIEDRDQRRGTEEEELWKPEELR